MATDDAPPNDPVFDIAAEAMAWIASVNVPERIDTFDVDAFCNVMRVLAAGANFSADGRRDVKRAAAAQIAGLGPCPVPHFDARIECQVYALAEAVIAALPTADAAGAAPAKAAVPVEIQSDIAAAARTLGEAGTELEATADQAAEPEPVREAARKLVSTAQGIETVYNVNQIGKIEINLIKVPIDEIARLLRTILAGLGQVVPGVFKPILQGLTIACRAIAKAWAALVARFGAPPLADADFWARAADDRLPLETPKSDAPIRQLSEKEVRDMILRGETPDPRACEEVFRINLNGTKIDDLAPLTTLANLQGLYLSGTTVADLAPLKDLANLQTLDLHNTQVADLTPVRHVPDIWNATAEAYATIGRDERGRRLRDRRHRAAP
ncbi:MAG: leucine-rich repeat domain-containing protein [Maricaulaceae bacterium]